VTNKHEDHAKLLFGVVYSLRNLTRKLSTPYHPFPVPNILKPYPMQTNLGGQRRQLYILPNIKV
jgi:hypothetical protein